ncbi:hypothetical protein D9615_004460 [Tricholomella constricta]|uniref:Asl1-like glycosyl hydrolase catalytic domain-containing protein n=1 Tax=Tricholomella constricta TaxID=117010 RepID=A0A8H5HFF5_9AGAR|nr:hypothetical protein D9615_004460 [Tricholomella constricta]
MVIDNFLQALFVVGLASQGIMAANRGLWVNRLNHRNICASRRPHSSVAPSGTTSVHVIATVLTTYSESPTPTSRFVTSTVTSKPLTRTATLSNSRSEDSTSNTHASSSTASYTAVTPPPTTSSSSFIPNGIKAGIAGGDAYSYFKDHIGWWYDWTPNPSKPGNPIGVPMLWGGGTADSTDAARLAAFKKISAAPSYVLAYEEPDCPSGSGSAGMSVSSGVSGWESLIVPLGKKGSLMGSPSMCKQADETWLAQFRSKISTEWDFTAVHINKNNLEGVKKDIEHYWTTYKKPIWVTEFACVNAPLDKNGFVPCTDQREINDYINAIVPYLQTHQHVHAYAYSNGLGLGKIWPLMKGGSLSASGKAYLEAISRYH